MILFKCDRCGKVISPYVYRIRIETFTNTDFAMDRPMSVMPPDAIPAEISEDILPTQVYGMHFCRDCIEQIAAFAMNYGSPNPEMPKKEKRKTGPKPIDDGKIRALFEAGWDPKDIAKEPGVDCQETTVRDHLSKMGLRRRA